MTAKCPKCGSKNTEEVDIFGSMVLVCNDCGYDEAEDYPTEGEKSGKKSRNVYRTGGGKRSSGK